MNYILWFLKLRFLILKNSLFKDTKAIIRTMSIAIVIIIAQILLTNVLYKNIFSSISDEQALAMLIVFFFIAVMWIYLSAFVQSISSFVRNFFKSPDMNYLISIPIPSDYVFLFKFLDHIINIMKSMIFIFFPFLAAIGIWVNASIFYFVAIIPIYIIVSIIPCTIGVVVAMAGVRIISAKKFSIITSTFLFATNIIFAILFSRVQDVSMEYYARLFEFLQKPFMSDLIPLTASIRIFYAAAFGDRTTYALLFLLIISALFMAAAFIISKKLFFEGWAKNQNTHTEVNKKRAVLSKNYKDSKNSEVYEWIKTEWKMAIRNQEMLIGSIFMLLIYVFAVFVFIYKGYFLNEPLLGIFILITIASIFNIIAVSIPFVPVDITKDNKLWKNRYWLLKVMPIEGSKVFNIQCNMFFVLAYLISLAGILSYSIISGLGLPLILLSALALLVILYGSSAIYTSVELLSLSDFFDKNGFIGNLITIIFPALYGVLSAGTIAMFLAKEFVDEIIIISNVSKLLNLPIAVIVSVTTVSITYFIARKIYIRVWDGLEI
ncbi:UNVERIFIED_CONTAM: putative ABC exporter [Acetivibrio alkalicellulosi]